MVYGLAFGRILYRVISSIIMMAYFSNPFYTFIIIKNSIHHDPIKRTQRMRFLSITINKNRAPQTER